MFERYSENARRTIFYARYEASRFGTLRIEAEYLLLGLFRVDQVLGSRLPPGIEQLAAIQESIRKDIEDHHPVREKVSTSIDLPLTEEANRALVYAEETAERLGHSQVGTEHLLLGLLRQENSFAASLLHARGLHLAEMLAEFDRP